MAKNKKKTGKVKHGGNNSGKSSGVPKWYYEELEKLSSNKNKVEETGIWSKLRTHGTIIGIMVSVIAIIVAILQWREARIANELAMNIRQSQQLSKLDSLKNSINSKIDFAESHFKMDESIIDGDTAEYINILNEIKKETLKYCRLYRSSESDLPLMAFSSEEDFSKIFKNAIVRDTTLYDSMKSIHTLIHFLSFIEVISDSLIDKNMTKLSDLKWNKLKSSYDSLTFNDSIIFKDVKGILDQENIELINDRDKKKILAQAGKRYDDSKRNIHYYQCVNDFFEYAIDCVQLFDSSKGYFRDKHIGDAITRRKQVDTEI